MGIQPGQEIPPLVKAMAEFREAAEFQQMYSEMMSHAQQSFEQVDEDSPHYEYYKTKVAEMMEEYADIRRYVHDKGLIAVELADPTSEEPRVLEATPEESALVTTAR